MKSQKNHWIQTLNLVFWKQCERGLLKKKTGAKSKVDVVRTALALLEADVKRAERVKRWEKAAKVIGSSGLEVLKEFQTPERFKNLP